MSGRLLRHAPGSLVTFKNPTSQEGARGVLVDEVWSPEPESFGPIAMPDAEGWLETAFVAQLIDWSGERRIRIAYYTRRADGDAKSWVYGQYAPSMGVTDVMKLMREMQERGWLGSFSR